MEIYLWILKAGLDYNSIKDSFTNVVEIGIPVKSLFAVQAEMVAVEISIDAGYFLWIFYECLSHYSEISHMWVCVEFV